jgi:hypothetical protein
MSPLETLMRRVTRAAASATLQGVPTDFWRRLFPKTAIGVCYHMVSDAAVPHLRHYPFLDQTAFEADLAYLQRHFTIMHYPDLARRRAAGDGTRRNEVSSPSTMGLPNVPESRRPSCAGAASARCFSSLRI